MSSIDKINVGGVDFDITSSPTPVMAPVETGTTATQAYVVGDYVIVGSTLHEVTAAIAIGDTFTEGTNISTSTSLGDEISQLNNDLTKKALVNTYYDSSTKKLYEVNSDGTQGGEISMGSPILDFANPLFTFTGENTTYTATKECYVVGSLNTPYADNIPTALSINNTVIFQASNATNAIFNTNLPYIKIKSGDVVSLSNGSFSIIKVYDVIS